MPRSSLWTLLLAADGSSAKAERALAAMEAAFAPAEPVAKPAPAAPVASLDPLNQMFAYYDPLATGAPARANDDAPAYGLVA